jgi:hypothetical protein
VLKQWLTQYFEDFREDSALLDRLVHFIDDVLMPEALVTTAEQLKALIDKKQKEHERTDKALEKEFQFSTLPPTPILPVKLKRPLKVR